MAAGEQVRFYRQVQCSMLTDDAAGTTRANNLALLMTRMGSDFLNRTTPAMTLSTDDDTTTLVTPLRRDDFLWLAHDALNWSTGGVGNANNNSDVNGTSVVVGEGAFDFDSWCDANPINCTVLDRVYEAYAPVHGPLAIAICMIGSILNVLNILVSRFSRTYDVR